MAPDDVPAESDANAQTPALATAPAILDLAASELEASGLAGERRLVQLLYLVVTSRLLDRPCSIAVKGPSSAGKSHVVAQVLDLFPPSAYYALSAMSERALAYDREPVSHRMLVLYEAAGIHGDFSSYLMRSLLSEGRIDYVTVVKGKAGFETKRISREGPTGLITTTTAVSLHPENETRLLSVTVADTPAQTRAVMLAQARRGRPAVDRAAWHEFQGWLAERPFEVVIPCAEALANLIPPVATRMRRDFPTLLRLIEAHALLHRASRRELDGAIVAEYRDYAVVRELVGDLLADSSERAVSPSIRETVQAIEQLTTPGDLLDEGITVARVGEALGVDTSTAWRRVRRAIARGFVKNLETRPRQAARLVAGDPMPEDRTLLPTVHELRLHDCVPDEGDDDVEALYPRSAWDPDAGDDGAPETSQTTSGTPPAESRA